LLSETVRVGFAWRYEELGAKVRELAAPLSEDQFWTKPYGFGNSFGHLVLHLTGNLNYYIGSEVAASGYKRDRNREFTDPTREPKDAVMKRFADAVAMVVRVARSQEEHDWAREYKALLAEGVGNRFNIFLQCVTHLHLHIGQMMYLQSELMRR